MIVRPVHNILLLPDVSTISRRIFSTAGVQNL